MAYTTINKGSDYFNTKLYTGTGSDQNITGVGFQPDFLWVKERSSTSNHMLFDVVRGGTLNRLNSNTTSAEITSDPAVAFLSDGFSVSTGDNGMNENTQTYAAWNWLANNTSGSSNTDGSITSTVSANTTSGFSIVSYTGTGANATVGHGLNSAPEMIIVKNRIDAGINWVTGCEYYSGWDYVIELNLTDAESNAGGAPTNFTTTAPTSSVYSVGTSNNTNGSGDGIIAYCFHSVKGYSKIGKYTGNGNADGTFVYTGFKPAFLIAKRTDGTSGWIMLDNKRNPSNVVSKLFDANESAAEVDTFDRVDFLSNGFKCRGTAQPNSSGGTYIYMAFAENPLVGSNLVPNNAR